MSTFFFPSFVKATFKELSQEFNLKIIIESSSSVKFQNKNIELIITLEELKECDYGQFGIHSTVEYISVSLIGSNGISIPISNLFDCYGALQYFIQEMDNIDRCANFSKMNKNTLDVYNNNQEILKAEIILFHEIIKKYLKDLLRGRLNECAKKILN